MTQQYLVEDSDYVLIDREWDTRAIYLDKDDDLSIASTKDRSFELPLLVLEDVDSAVSLLKEAASFLLNDDVKDLEVVQIRTLSESPKYGLFLVPRGTRLLTANNFSWLSE